MIEGRDIQPDRKIYYLGAVVLKAIAESPSEQFDFLEVFQSVNKQEKISMNLFVLTLDWLFLLGVINNINGVFQRCF